MRDLIVSEIFGPTFQGEGPSTGRRAGFLRLGLCNLNCSWCDTPYTWDWLGEVGPRQDRSLLLHVTMHAALSELTALQVPLVVVTGGEPTLQQPALAPLVEELVARGMAVEIETNGTRPITEPALRELVAWNVSPKLSGSGVPADRALVLDVLADLVNLGARYKFVVSDLAELDEIADLCKLVEIPAESVWIMPEGRSASRIEAGLRRLAGPVLDLGWQLGTRLHVTIWDDERGR